MDIPPQRSEPSLVEVEEDTYLGAKPSGVPAHSLMDVIRLVLSSDRWLDMLQYDLAVHVRDPDVAPNNQYICDGHVWEVLQVNHKRREIVLKVLS